MPKRHLTPTEAFELRQVLQVATLEALMASRRWEPGDLVFQGGTSLHLVHGSPRYSEDLDFLVNASLNLKSLANAVASRLEGASWLVPEGAELTVSKAQARRKDLASSTDAVAKDLKRWLPSSWPLTEAAAGSMIQTAIKSLDEGIRVMREIAANRQGSAGEGE